MSEKKSFRCKRLFSVIALALTVPISVKLMMLSLPYMNAAASQAALFSAGLAMPEGGKAVLEEGMAVDTAEATGSAVSSFAASSKNVSSAVSSKADAPLSSASSALELTSSTGSVKESNKGKIVRQLYNAGASGDLINLEHGGVRNSTGIATATVKKELAKKLDFNLTKTAEPQVLIYHTHATESYEPVTRDYYDKTYHSRTRDNNYNMIMVGNEIEAQLKAVGIGVVHDLSQHDYPSYTGAYALSMKTIRKHRKAHPTIQVCLDIHRDAIQRGDGTRIAPTAKINGKNAAQIMLVAGAEKEGDITHDFYQNLRFAAHLQNRMESDNPGLMRPISFAYRKYNQSASPGTLLIEVGGHGNSLEEARYAGELAGKSIAKALLAMMK